MMIEREKEVVVGGGKDEEEKKKKPDELTPKDHSQHKEEVRSDDKRVSTSSPPPVKVVITTSISRPEEVFTVLPKSDNIETEAGATAAAASGLLQRSDSYHEVCRVCQQQTEESLIELGCRCRGELSKAHQSCINIWFHSRGSNKCEICQQIATNTSPDHSLPNYWVWRVDPPRGSSSVERVQGRFSPLWMVFIFLIGGLLLDVLISLSLGFSSLPIDIIIGVLIVLGVGTAFRLVLECFNQWNFRRRFQMSPDTTTLSPGYPPPPIL